MHRAVVSSVHPAFVLPSLHSVLVWAEAATDCPRCAADREAPLRILEDALIGMAVSALPYAVLGVLGALLYRFVVSARQQRARVPERSRSATTG